MKHYITQRGSYIVGNSYKNFFSKNKLLIFILLFAVLLGIITGIFTALKASEDLSKFNINDGALVKYLKGDSSLLGYFSSRFFYYSFILLCVFMLTFIPILIPVPIIFLIYKSFILGSNVVVLIVLFGFKGIFNVVFILFPCHLLMLLCLILIITCFILRASARKRYGRNCEFSNGKRWFLFLIPIFIICLIEAILINFTYKTFIFVI